MAKTIHMTPADHKLVSDAVGIAEARSNGEIVTIVTDLSDHYSDIPLRWAAIAAFVTFAVIIGFPDYFRGHLDRMAGGWNHVYTDIEILGLIFALMLAKFMGVWLILQFVPIRMLFTPGRIKSARVRARAITLFKVGTESRTIGLTGILIYLSTREHRAEIVADEAIAKVTTPECWGEAMAALLDGVKRGEPGQGMADAVRLVGDVLATHFPKSAHDTNELPDRLIEL